MSIQQQLARMDRSEATVKPQIPGVASLLFDTKEAAKLDIAAIHRFGVQLLFFPECFFTVLELMGCWSCRRLILVFLHLRIRCSLKSRKGLSALYTLAKRAVIWALVLNSS